MAPFDPFDKLRADGLRMAPFDPFGKLRADRLRVAHLSVAPKVLLPRPIPIQRVLAGNYLDVGGLV